MSASRRICIAFTLEKKRRKGRRMNKVSIYKITKLSRSVKLVGDRFAVAFAAQAASQISNLRV